MQTSSRWLWCWQQQLCLLQFVCGGGTLLRMACTVMLGSSSTCQGCPRHMQRAGLSCCMLRRQGSRRSTLLAVMAVVVATEIIMP